jgi:hypothetical protein
VNGKTSKKNKFRSKGGEGMEIGEAIRTIN